MSANVISGKNEWFYSDAVKEHFFHPKNIFKTEDEKKRYKADGVGIVGSPACIDKTTIIHTNSDIKPIEELTNRNTVFSHDGTYNQISKSFRIKYSGILLKIKNSLGDVVLTPDHLIYAIKLPSKKYYMHTKYKKKFFPSWVHAGNLNKGDVCLYPIPLCLNHIKYVEIPIKKFKYDFRSKGLSSVEISNDFLKLCGYFVAEGNTRKDGKEMCFSFGIHEMKLAKDVERILKKLFNLEAHIKIRVSENKIEVLVYNVHLARSFRNAFGNYSYNKKIPDFIIFLEPELQKSFIAGLWKGDGYIKLYGDKPRAEFVTTSLTLANQLKLMLLRQGIQHSIYSESPKNVRGINHRRCFRIHVGDFDALKKISRILKVRFSYPPVSRTVKHSWFDDNFFYSPIRKIEKTTFSGHLSNLLVEDTHSYVSNAFALHNCGDVMELMIKVKNDKIIDCKWSTFGCASAIASTSMLSLMVTEKGGMKLDDALKIKPNDIMKRLGGLPERKVHCSVLGDKALRAAINDYFRKSEQYERIAVDSGKIVDKILKITDKDIEQAVLEGAKTFEDVQKKTKVGIQDKSCIPEVKRLIEQFKEKYCEY